MAKKTLLLRGQLTKVSSQRTQYKPYGYELDFAAYALPGPDVFIEVEIENREEVVVEEGEYTDGHPYVVLNLDGLNAILRVTADSIDKLEEEYESRFMK
jgi:hypothetical protein